MEQGKQSYEDARGELTFRVDGMDCADCALHLERAVARLEGVDRVEVSFATGRMRLAARDAASVVPRVRRLARRMGYEAVPDRGTQAPPAGLWAFLRRHRSIWPSAGAGLLLLTAFALRLLGGPALAAEGLLVAATLVAGFPLARAAWATLRSARTVDMNGLMTIAAVGALAIGEYAEAAVATFLFTVGEALETYTADRARGAVRALMDLRPAEATRLTEEGEERVLVEALAVGDRLLIRPGERVPADGRVLEGRSTLNQATITGEGMPVDKGPGDEVFAGTVNGAGALVVGVTRVAEDSTLARIVRLVTEAQEQRAPSQRFVDRFARIYTPAVVAVAALVAAVPPLVGWGVPLDWVYRALTLLVIACPCALVISTPVAMVSGLTAAARAGVLIKGGVHLEQLARVRAVAFDKTGTLTRGEPRLVDGQCADHDPRLAPRECVACLDMLAKAAAVERRSEHPLAQAVVEAADALGVGERYRPAEAVEAAAGQGVRGRVEGHEVAVGSHAFVHGAGEPGEFCRLVEAAAANGQTAVVVADLCCGQRAYGLIADTLREEAASVLAELKRLGVRQTVMLTGDNPATAEAVARAVGVDEVRAGLLPQEKVAAVGELLAAYGTVAMVGDGVNDAPALARASVGIAMGAAGSDVALETADVALMGDDLRGLPAAVRISRRALRAVRQNVALALATKGLFLALAVAGLATLWMAVFADVGVSLLVILNGMRVMGRERGLSRQHGVSPSS